MSKQPNNNISSNLFHVSNRHEHMSRIKLIFDDNIVIAKEYRKIWFLIPETVRFISDLVYLIKSKFSLKKASNGLYLVLDDFTLPFTQSIQIIRESDVIMYINILVNF